MSDIDVVRGVYSAMAERDLDRLFELIDATCVITQDPVLPWGGHHVGHEGLATLAASLTGTIDSAVTTDAFFEADGEVIQCGRTRGVVRATGAAFDLPEVHRWTIRDGRAVAAHFAVDTPGMLQALGAS